MKAPNHIFSFILIFATLWSQKIHAISPTPLTPAWFTALKDGYFEDTNNVWRGQVFDVPTPGTLLLKNSKGDVVSVKLLHLSSPKDIKDSKLLILNSASKTLVGLQVYVLGKSNKSAIVAKILDVDGNDINLRLISSGSYDLNTTSLFLKKDKQKYLNALHSAQRTRVGIWR